MSERGDEDRAEFGVAVQLGEQRRHHPRGHAVFGRHARAVGDHDPRQPGAGAQPVAQERPHGRSTVGERTRFPGELVPEAFEQRFGEHVLRVLVGAVQHTGEGGAHRVQQQARRGRTRCAGIVVAQACVDPDRRADRDTGALQFVAKIGSKEHRRVVNGDPVGRVALASHGAVEREAVGACAAADVEDVRVAGFGAVGRVQAAKPRIHGD